MFKIPSKEGIKTKPNLSILALSAFTASFVIARIFTTLNPVVALTSGGFHIHHFWYGLVLLAIGGWLGISYQNERVDRIASILFGAGGGLIADEVGLLLSFGDYWAEITYTFVIVFLASAITLILLNRYSRIIRTEFAQFLRTHVSLYFGVFLAAVSTSFILESDNIMIMTISGVLTIASCTIIFIYFIQRTRTEHQKKSP